MSVSCTVNLYISNLSSEFIAIQTTYTKARANLAKLCNQVTENREIVIINRRGNQDVALVSADELSSLIETAHLLKVSYQCEAASSSLEPSKIKESKTPKYSETAPGDQT